MGKIVLPPPSAPKTKKNKYATFAAWAKKQGIAAATAADIWYWSHHTPNVDAYLWTSVLLVESGAKHVEGNGKLVSSGQAVGIGQIALSWVGQPIPWNPKRKFTADNDPQTGIANYGVNLRMSATLWGDAVSKYGWQKAYTSGYNPNDKNNAAAWHTAQTYYQSRPAGNPPIGSPSQGPADTSATSQVGTTTTAPEFKDPYVVGVRGDKKHVKLVTTFNPNKALQYNGSPLTRSGFLSIRDQLTTHYVSYTGGRPTLRQIDNYIRNGWNPYTLDVLLSKSKAFPNSPIYKQFVPEYKAALKNLLPDGEHIPAEMLRQGVINKWSSDVLADKVRKLPSYLKSKEFKGNVTSLMNVYTSIMGNPSDKSMQEALTQVRDAALEGWSTDQFAAFLRGHQNYSYSTEYQSKAMGFLESLGLITGSRPVLGRVGDPGPGNIPRNTAGNLTPDKRVKGDPNANYNTPLAGLGATLG